MNITEKDVRSMIRLLGETAALDGAHTEKKRHLMDGTCELINADAWVWTLGCHIKPGDQQVYAGFLHGGFDETRFANLLKAIEHPDMGKVASNFFLEVKASMKHTTMRRDEIDPDGLAHISDAGELWRKANIDSLLMSGYPLDDDSLSCVGFYRKVDDDAFSRRDRKIAHIILSEVPWLHMSGWPEDRGATVPKLYPRQRIVLNLLLDGMNRKQISAQMDISENTVSGYTKDIYRHFGVNSHVDLMCKFLHAKA